MRGFLRRAGFTLGRALVSWGLGSTNDAPPTPVVITGPCVTSRLARDGSFTAELAPALSASGALGDLTSAGTLGDATFTAGLSDAC